MPAFITNLIKSRNIQRRRWLRTRLNYYKHELKRLNENIRYHISNFRNRSWNSLLESLEKGSPPFWNITKVIRKKNKLIPTLKDQTNRYTTQAEKTEILARTFHANHVISSSLSNPNTIQEVNNKVRDLNAVTPIIEENYFITFRQIKDILQDLKNKKAPGIDGINNLCLKNLPKRGIKVLTGIINACLKLQYYPTKWKESKIIAIGKPNKPSDSPSSYRPISLLSAISKILEKVLKIKLTQHTEDSNILRTTTYFPRNNSGFEENTIPYSPFIASKKLSDQTSSKVYLQ